MRSSRLLASVAAVIAVLAMAGVGLSAFSSYDRVDGTAAAGTLGPFSWASPSAHGYGSYDTCSVLLGTQTSPGDTLGLMATNLAPGDFCGYSAELTNHGSLPGTVAETITSASGALCASLVFSDNGFTPGVTIGA